MNMYLKRKHTPYIAIICLIAGLMLLASFYNPNDSPLIVFLAIFLILYLLACLIIMIITKLSSTKASSKQTVFIASVLAFCPVTLLSLSSLGNLTLLDAILALGVPGIVVWYGLKNHLVH
jgi:hypothetical protein